MKPTSIVFLVIAAILIIGGMITCTVAENIADTDGYALFYEAEDGTSFRQYDFTDKPITKIDLAVENAEIHICGGSEASYIELINFREGLYTFSTSGTIIAMDQIPNLESIMDFSSGFSFGGIRQFFRKSTNADAPRRINIYLSGHSDNLKVISIGGQSCDITLDTLTAHCDITVNIDTLTVDGKDIHTESALTVTAKSADITLKNATVHSFSLTADTGDLRADNFSFASFDCTLTTGDASVSTALPLTLYNADVSGGTGALQFGGLDRPRPYSVKAAGEAAGTIRFDSAAASFSVTDASDPAA